jgi:hypothetical protein
VKSLEGAMLTRGNSLSCGCLKRDVVSYGLLPEYNAWRDMIRRCYNQSADAYENYGGRGITVCPEWLSSFEAFLSDMGKIPSDKHSLDRIDKNRGHEKANCLWATRGE